MAEQRQPHWLVPVVVSLLLASVVTWLGLNDWRLPGVNNPNAPSGPAESSPAASPSPPRSTRQLTEYERLAATSPYGPPRSLVTTPPKNGNFNCLAEQKSFLDDERDFMWIKDVQTHDSRPWRADGLTVEDGHIYMLAIYPVNCGLATGDPEDGILREATMRIDMPSRSDTPMRLGTILRSTYLDHPVWDGVQLIGPRPFTVKAIPGSVQYMSSQIVQSDERRLPDSVFETAQLIGDKGQDGILRACAKAGDPTSVKCHLLIYAQVQVSMP